MSSARVQKLNALLSRVQERRVQPRLSNVALNVPAVQPRAPSPAQAAPAHMAPTPQPLAPVASVPAPAATLPPAGSAPSMRPDEAPRRPASSPLEDAMAQFGANREDSGPLMVESLSSPIHTIERPSEPVNQDLLMTHRPAPGSQPPGPIVELVQPKHQPREPTLQFETAVRANPPTQRDLKPAGLAEPPAEAPLSAPTQKLEPAPIATQTTPVRIVSSARQEAPKTFGELLEQSLSLRPSGR